MAILSLIPVYGSPTRRFEALIHRHYRTLYRTAYRWTRSIEDAEDLVQEVCIRAYPRLDELEQLDQPASWLTRVMYRLFVDLTRRHDRSRVDTMESGDLANLKCERPGPDEIAERSVNAERLARAWQRLDREKRTLLALHDIEGYPLAELTRITGLKEGTLKSRLHRSRVLLGRLLEQEAAVTRLKIGAGGKK